MTIDWNAFTPWPSLAGGVLIGIAAVMLKLFNGRIAGVSGVLGGLLRTTKADMAWRLAFLGGLVVAPLAFGLLATLPEVRITASSSALLLAGLLVGLGTRYASGCTSGHGVCGLSQFSLRSLVATLSFMASGFVTVFVLRHLLGS